MIETIPGKNYMALELPNAKRQIVRLTEILSSKVYSDAASNLTIALGKDIAGNPVVADLSRMPHLLVAGTRPARANPSASMRRSCRCSTRPPPHRYD